MKKIAYSIFIIYLITRSFLFYTAYHPFGGGDIAALRYFSAGDILKGLEYTRTGYEIKVLLFALTSIYFFLCIGENARRVSFKRYESLLTKWPSIGAMAYFGEFYAGLCLAGLPCVFALGFVKERGFNFSNLSAPAWLWFYIKARIVEFLFLAIIVSAVRYIAVRFSKNWHIALPVFSFAAAVALSAVLQFAVIPAFYNYSRVGDEKLRALVAEISKAAGVEINAIDQIDESSYSNHTNAFFTGIGPWKRIVFCDTLIKSHSSNEAAVIFAHELGHYVNNHELTGILLAVCGISILCLFMKLALHISGTGLESLLETDYPQALPVFFILYSCFYFFAMPVENLISRAFERQADDFAMYNAALGRDFDNLKESRRGVPAGAITMKDVENSYINLARQNRSNLTPDIFNYIFFASHPRAIDRVTRPNFYSKLNAPESHYNFSILERLLFSFQKLFENRPDENTSEKIFRNI